MRDSNRRPSPTHKELIDLARTHGRVRNHPSFGHELIFSPKGLAALIEAVTEPKDESPAYRPSGLMCYVCARRDADCSKLDFASMRRIKTDRDGVTVVKCNQFKKDVA